MNAIEKIFFDNLDGKFARVKSEGLSIEGYIDQRCKLEFVERYGLKCCVKLEYNSTDIIRKIEKLIIRNKNELSLTMKQIDGVVDLVIPEMINSYVRVAMISCYDVKNILADYSKGILTSIKIQYNNGSITHIYGISDKELY